MMAFSIFAMPSSSILLLLSAAFGVSHALPWSGPQETKVYKEHEWSPAPTVVPVNPAELFKRSSVDVNICGWIGGNSAAAAVCSSGSSCVHDTIHGYVGCCTTDGPCTAGVYTSCVDKNSQGWSPNSGLADNGVYTCTADDVCYRNTYPGGYYQYGCGSSNWGTSVATTYSGQPSDELLQIVYTGVNFTPTSAAASPSTSSSSSAAGSSSAALSSPTMATSTSTNSSPTSASSTASQTSSVAGNTTSTNTISNSQTSPAAKSHTGVIVGASVAGAVTVAVLLLLASWLWRRRYNKKSEHYAGPFISSHKRPNSQEPALGPFSDPAPFSPDDIGAPMAMRRPGPLTHHYASVSGIHNPNNQESPFLSREEAPAVSEIDDFSRSFHDAVNSRNEETGTTHNNTDELPDTVAGVGLGVGAGRRTSLRRGGSGSSSEYSRPTRIQTRNLTGDSFRTQNEGWVPQRLRTRSDRYTSGGDETVNLRGGGNRSPELHVPPKSPLRQTVKFPKDNRPRYQLVDEVVGDDVPILSSPGQLRHTRGR